MLSRELNRPPRIALITATAWKSGCRRGSPRWPMRISLWTEPGPVDHADEARRRRRRCRRWAPGSSSAGPAQSPNSDSAMRTTASGSTSPATTSAALCGHEGPVVDGAQLRRREALDRLGGPAGRPVVRARGGVDRRDVRLVGTAAWVGLRLEQVREPLVAQALDLGLGEARAADDLRQQRRGAGSRRLAGTSRPAEVASHPASAWIEAPRRSAASVSAMASRDLGALGQAPGREDRGAADGVGLVDGAGAHGERGRDQVRGPASA